MLAFVVALRRTSYRAGGNIRLAAKLKLVFKQTFETTLVHDQHNEVDLFRADTAAPNCRLRA